MAAIFATGTPVAFATNGIVLLALGLTSKTKILYNPVNNVNDLPEWGFDGSSTMQASGDNSDCALKPVFMVPDSIRGENNILVMCEVFNADGTPHITNTRSKLRLIAEKYQ